MAEGGLIGGEYVVNFSNDPNNSFIEIARLMESGNTTISLRINNGEQIHSILGGEEDDVELVLFRKGLFQLAMTKQIQADETKYDIILSKHDDDIHITSIGDIPEDDNSTGLFNRLIEISGEFNPPNQQAGGRRRKHRSTRYKRHSQKHKRKTHRRRR